MDICQAPKGEQHENQSRNATSERLVFAIIDQHFTSFWRMLHFIVRRVTNKIFPCRETHYIISLVIWAKKFSCSEHMLRRGELKTVEPISVE